MEWIRATASYGNGECVELASDGDLVLVRDSKNRVTQEPLAFTQKEWAAFLDGAKAGEFDYMPDGLATAHSDCDGELVIVHLGGGSA